MELYVQVSTLHIIVRPLQNQELSAMILFAGDFVYGYLYLFETISI